MNTQDTQQLIDLAHRISREDGQFFHIRRAIQGHPPAALDQEVWLELQNVTETMISHHEPWLCKFTKTSILDRVIEFIQINTHYEEGITPMTISIFLKEMDDFEEEWTVYIPLRGIDTVEIPHPFGDVVVTPITPEDKALILGSIEAMSIDDESKRWHQEYYKRRLGVEYIHGVYAKVTYNGDIEKTNEVALLKVKQLLQVFRIICILRNPAIDDDHLDIDLANPINFRDIYTYNSSHTHTKLQYLTHGSNGSVFDRIVFNDITSAWDEYHGQDVHRIMHSPSTRPERQLSRYLQWIDHAYYSKGIESKFLCVSTAIENLLSYFDDGVAESIAKGVSLVITGEVADTDEYRQIKVLYDIRSSIVHGRSSCVSADDYIRFRRLTISVFKFIYDNIYNIPDVTIAKWLSRQTFSL